MRRGVGAVLALLLVGVVASTPSPSTPEAYMARQAAALQPAFRADLEALAEAPRYTIQATIDPEGGKVAGQMQLDYTNTTGQALSELAFRLYPNAQTIYGGGSLSLRSVTEGGIARETELSDDGTVLRVKLEAPLEPGEIVSLQMSFDAQVPYGTDQGYGIFNRAMGVVCLAGWYPVLAAYGDDGWDTSPVPATGDALLAVTSFYEVKLSVPAGYQIVSTGSVLGQEKSGTGVTWHLVSGPAREFAVAVSQNFQTLEAQAGEVTLRLHTLPAEEPAVAPGTGLEILTETFATYEERFGPYPFVEFDLVEAVVPIDGYEFPGMAYVDYAKRTQETGQDYRYTVAHEVAHQWWYGLVGNHPVREPWLDEALASYAVLVVLEDTQGSKAGAALLDQWSRTDGPRGPEDPPVNSSTLHFSTWGPYHATVYTRGALFLDELRRALGDEGFFALLKRYQQTYRYQIGSTGDFLGMAEEVPGRDLDALFTAWFQIEAAQTSRGGEGVSASSSPRTRLPSTNSRLSSRRGGPPE